MSDASLEPAGDLGRTSVPVGDYRLEVGPTPGMAISAATEPPVRAGEQQRQLARAAARADKDPDSRQESADGPETTVDATLVGDVQTVSDRADQATTQVERADHLWTDLAAGRLQITSVNDELDTMLALLQKLDRDGRFEEQLRLARVFSKLLAVAMRWLDLLRSLRGVLAAAERHGHDEARAWALHELGTLHLAAGHLVRADHDLSQAAELRRRLNDERGRAATERNLQVLCRTLRQMMRTRRLVERRGIRRFIPASNAILAALVVIVLGAATAGAAGTGLIGGGGATHRPGGSGLPVITGLSPHIGKPGGGTLVLISGTGLAKTSAVMFGSHRVTAIKVVNDPQLAVIAPSGAGTVDVTLVTPKGSSKPTAADRFTYQASPRAPEVTKISPATGRASGGTPVTITGVNLNGATAVDFGTTPTTKLRPISDTRLQATSPIGSGTVDVTVVGPGGRSATSAADRFGYVSGPPPRPAVTHIEPKRGATGGGTLVTIYGRGLAKASAVHFASQASSRLQPISEDELKAVAPAGSNTVDVTVTTPGGTSAEVSTARYTYLTASSAPPTVTQVKPNQGYENGGEPVTITGTGLSGATGVDFGGAAVARSQLTSVSDTELRVVSPAETETEIAQDTPTVDVTVTTAAGTSKTGAADQFTYVPLPPAPKVAGIRPTRGAADQTVIIRGINLAHVTRVSFGTAETTLITPLGDDELTVTSPAKAPADPCTVPVTVTDAAGQPSTSPIDFTYCDTSSSSSSSSSASGSSSSSSTSSSSTTTTSSSSSSSPPVS